MPVVSAELVEWLAAQLDADGRVARAALDPDDPAPWASLGTLVAGTSGLDRGSGERLRVLRAHIALNDPSHVLRVVAAHQAILAEFERVDGRSAEALDKGQNDLVIALRAKEVGLRHAVRAVASIYSDRPGYAEEWKP